MLGCWEEVGLPQAWEVDTEIEVAQKLQAKVDKVVYAGNNQIFTFREDVYRRYHPPVSLLNGELSLNVPDVNGGWWGNIKIFISVPRHSSMAAQLRDQYRKRLRSLSYIGPHRHLLWHMLSYVDAPPRYGRTKGSYFEMAQNGLILGWHNGVTNKAKTRTYKNTQVPLHNRGPNMSHPETTT